MRLIVTVWGLAALLAGCGTTAPVMKPEQWTAVVERDYPHVTPTQAFDAAERLLALADEDDVQFTRSETLFEAFRDWSKYAVLHSSAGSDYWTLAAREHEHGVKLVVQVSRIERSVTVGFPAGSTPVANVGNMDSAPIEGSAVYDLFWARMDYLLGRRADWATCEDAKAAIARRETHGSVDPLCNAFNMDDKSPAEPIITYPAASRDE
jgi:hypothetical protein